MTPIVMLLVRIVLAAAWTVWHVRLGISVTTSSREVPTWWRVCGWIPLLSPVIGWLMQLRATSIVWLLLAGLYLAVTVAS